MVEGKGIEPLTHACKAHVFPLAPTPHKTLVPPTRIELVIKAYQASGITVYLQGCIFNLLNTLYN